jgi:hypothetical protein
MTPIRNKEEGRRSKEEEARKKKGKNYISQN